MRKLTILWLDDIRDPDKYLNKPSKSGTFARNKQFYDNLMSQYDVRFIWVKNFEEFTSFIMKNGLPEFISFDHDLGAGLKKGLDCAKWLIEYCSQNNQKLPKFFVHSANPNGQREINGILNNALMENKHMNNKLIRLTESDLYNIIRKSVNKVLTEDESYVDRMIRARYAEFDRSKLKVIFDNLGLKRGDGKYLLSGDYGYKSFKLRSPNVEFREYNDGKVFVFFGYDDNVGAWGGYTRKYEITDPDIFKRPDWMKIIRNGEQKTSPDVIMI